MMIPLFWGAIRYDYIAIENFIVKLSQTKLAGYPVPLLLGVSQDASISEMILWMEKIFIFLNLILGCLFICLSFFELSMRRWKFLSLALGFPVFLLLIAFWLKFNSDDHIIASTEKAQLYQTTLGLIIFTSVCFYFGLQKPRVRKKAKANVAPPVKASGSVSTSLKTEPPSATSILTAGDEANEDGDTTEQPIEETQIEVQEVTNSDSSERLSDSESNPEENITEKEAKTEEEEIQLEEPEQDSEMGDSLSGIEISEEDNPLTPDQLEEEVDENASSITETEDSEKA